MHMKKAVDPALVRPSTLARALPPALLAACLATPLLAQQTQYTTIALSGQAAPGTSLTFDFVSDPRIAEDGRILFWARLSGTDVTFLNDGSLWSNRGGTFALVAREGDPAPGISNGTLRAIPTGGFNWAKNIALSGVVVEGTPPSSEQTNVALFVESSSLGLVARDAINQQTLPGLIPLSPSGRSAWSTGTTIQIFPGTTVYTTTTPAPGPNLPPGSRLRYFGSPSLNDLGKVVFRSEAGVGTAPSPTNYALGLFTDRSGPLTQVALTGAPVPNDPGRTWAELSGDPLINDAGTLAFFARVAPSFGGPFDHAICMDVGSGPEFVVRAQDPVPNMPGVFFASFARRLSLTPRGGIVFLAYLTGNVTSENNAAVFALDPGGSSPRLIVRRGDQAADQAPGTVYNILGEPRASRAGRIAFTAHLRGGDVTPAGAMALFAADRAGTVRAIARAGQPFQVPAGPTKTIRSIVFDHDSTESGLGQWTSGGELVFKLMFTDNTHGLFSARVGCVADFDDGSNTGTPDGGITIDDLLFYLDRFAAGESAADIDDGTATATPDDGVTIDDLLYYLTRFDAGC
jgi:hypothetical protein